MQDAWLETPPVRREVLVVHVRWMIRRDMPEVLAAEAASDPCPWAEDVFNARLRNRNVIGMVAEAGEKVLGFMVYELHPDFFCLFRLAVHPDYRRRGVGAQLVAKVRSKLSAHRRTAILYDVRETDLPRQLFLRALGFRAEAVARGAFRDTGEDAYTFCYEVEG